MATSAAPRQRSQMAAIAIAAFQQQAPGTGVQRRAPQAVRELIHRDGLSVYGNGGHSLVVIAADDVAPAILGYTDKASTTISNENFRWWMEQMDAAVKTAAAQGTTMSVTTPDPTKYKEAIEPMVKTSWGQMAPYNNLCPIATGSNRCLTGCVATSIAQVLYYHHGPKTGYGRRTIYYPQYDTNGTPVFVDFSKETYDWDDMLLSYGSSTDASVGTISGTAQQQHAVAQLMRDLGVAVDMNYGESASGTNHGSAATGLQNYFGLKDAKKLDRKAYTEPAWMDIIYQQLNNNLPIVYGGLDAVSGGHSFVFDGYDKDGRVHVNWGWYGEDNGYFYVADLDPYHNGNSFAFNSAQDMIININPDVATEHLSATVNLAEAGTLDEKIDKAKKYDYDTLTVSGPINGSDIKLIREMAGRNATNGLTEGRLHVLNLTNARIVSGGDAYLTEDGKEYHTADDALTDKLFYGCSFLSIFLPDGIKTMGDGVLAMCNGLDSVALSDQNADNFKIADGIIYNKEGDEVISVLPNKIGNIYFTQGITKLHDYALAGCNHIRQVKLSSTVQEIGKEAFNDCINLNLIKTYSKAVPTLSGNDVFKGVPTQGLKVYVPKGSKKLYTVAEQWKDLVASNFVEFGTTIKARNATREVGQDNPEFSYQVIGDYVDGKAELTCDATKDSPAGKYVIHCKPGTITEEGVEYVDGWLIVRPASTAIKQITSQEEDSSRAYQLDGRPATPGTHGIIIENHRKILK